MKHLSAEHLLDIVRHLRSDLDSASQRRRQPRVGLRHTVRVIPCDEAQTPLADDGCRAWVRDVSRRGLGLLVNDEFTLGRTALLEISSEQNESPAYLLGRVVRCEALSQDHFHVGIELILDTPQDVMASYTKQLTAA